MSLLHELRSGERFALGGEAHRAKLARGPTTLEDLQQDGEKQEGDRPNQPSQTSSKLEVVEEENAEDGSGQEADRPLTPPLPPASDYIPSASFTGPRPGLLFKMGPQGLGYYSDPHQTDVVSAQADHQPKGQATQPQNSSTSTEEARMRAAELSLDQAAWATVSSRVRLHLASGGDFSKSVTGRAKLKGSFDVVTLGCRHVHLAGPQYMLQQVSSHCDHTTQVPRSNVCCGRP